MPGSSDYVISNSRIFVIVSYPSIMNFQSFVSTTLLLILLSTYSFAQKVTVSREIVIRNNYAYDILPNIGNRIIFYNDKGTEHSFEIYDKNLRYINTIYPEFEKKAIQPVGVLPLDSAFNFYYQYREGGFQHLKVVSFNENVMVNDSATLSAKEKKWISSTSRFAFSEDKSKVLVFTPDDKFLNLQLIDNKTLTVIYDINLLAEGINLKADFEKLTVANDGQIFIVARKSSIWGRNETTGFTLLRIKTKEEVAQFQFTPESDEITDILLDYDEINQRVVLAGLVSASGPSMVSGYFGFSMLPDDIPEEAEIIINSFTPEFIGDVSGKKPGKNRELSDFRLQNIVVRKDGGVILITEMVKEFARRGQMQVPGQFGGNFGSRNFMDYYYEDVLLFATYPNGREHWKKILFKKQFSQDDAGIYSSCFLFKTPSRLRLLYNDEIKNANTVSEYVLDGLGNAERKSVLSTEYQNLKLRFRDASFQVRKTGN
jgi:hypothetical protein